MKKIILAVFIILLSLLAFSFDQNPNNIFTKYRIYLSPDGIDSWTNFDINYTSEDFYLNKDSKIKYKISLEYKNSIIENDLFGQEIKLNNLELGFTNFRLQFNEESIKLYPDFILPNLYFYYKDLNGQYLDNRYMIAYNENDKFDLKNIIKDDEFGLGYDATINNNAYELNVSYTNSVKEKNSTISSKYNNIIDSNYILVEFDNSLVNTYEYDENDFNYSEKTFEYNDISYDVNLNLDFKKGLFKGFRTDNIFKINYDYNFDYDNKDITVNYLKTQKEVDSGSSTITYSSGQETFSYKEYTGFTKELNYDYLSDTYYTKTIIGKGYIFKPTINLYLKDNYYIVTNAYDHYMKLRYDFKGLSTMKATSTTLSFDTFFYGKNYNLNILDGIQFKLNDEDKIDNAFYFDINGIYRGFDFFRPELRVEYFNNEDIKNLTVTPRIFAKYDNLKLNIENYFDYDVINDEYENTFLINPYYSIDDLEIGIKIFNSKYRAFGDAYYREFMKKNDFTSWYIYIEFLKYFYL